MPAENPVRRSKTAKEMAARLGVSERTIRNVVAEPREEFEARAQARRQRAVELREQGLKYREIAEELSCSVGTVGTLLHHARKSGTTDQRQASA
jgi:DNA-directed RNA polymerase specialized sigma24 family protein